MRVFGYEITKSRPNPAADDVVWNVHGQSATRLSELSADDLRYELAIVHKLASQGACYYIRPGDVKQQLHLRVYQDLPTTVRPTA